MKTRKAFAESSKNTLIARYLRETSGFDERNTHTFHKRLELKDLGRSMLASVEKLKEFGGFSRGIKP